MSDVDLAALAKLREPVAANEISKLPKGKEDKAKRRKCSVCKGFHDPSMFHLDYMGHAAVTDRMLNADPCWSWEPFALAADGSPLMERDKAGNPVGLWIRLTIGGMTRPGYGSVEPGKPEAVKELIGDALRNASMRFGLGLELWHKGDLHADDDRSSPAASPAPDAPPADQDQLDTIKALRDGLPEARQVKFDSWFTRFGDRRPSTVEADEAIDMLQRVHRQIAEEVAA